MLSRSANAQCDLAQTPVHGERRFSIARFGRRYRIQPKIIVSGAYVREFHVQGAVP